VSRGQEGDDSMAKRASLTSQSSSMSMAKRASLASQSSSMTSQSTTGQFHEDRSECRGCNGIGMTFSARRGGAWMDGQGWYDVFSCATCCDDSFIGSSKQHGDQQSEREFSNSGWLKRGKAATTQSPATSSSKPIRPISPPDSPMSSKTIQTTEPVCEGNVVSGTTKEAEQPLMGIPAPRDDLYLLATQKDDASTDQNLLPQRRSSSTSTSTVTPSRCNSLACFFSVLRRA